MRQENLPSQEYVKLERRLVLLAWLNSLFGFASNEDMLADVREAAEGFDASDRSYVYHRLIARGGKVKVPAAELAVYDANIREHLRAMNAARPEPITLRHFQYMAALYSEIFLDAYCNRPAHLLATLNRFARAYNALANPGEEHEKFTAADCRKLAFWMATGSGKTLVLHLNYRQFLHYNREPLDNILLVTPNEGLSEQHIREMTASGIPCARFNPDDGGPASAPDTVRVLEITKLVEEKRGDGVSVSVESFEGNNLVFVDEGHKGSGGEVWRSFRDALGRTGFTFEYSATFGQALSASRNDDLTAEYGKSIAFDYSYRYFHRDGYGKDFRILNLREETTADKTDTLLLGNLLSFYEQQRVFAERGEALRPYNLEKPLWVFVGGSVNAVYTENREKRSDVLTVARFLHRLLANRRDWAVATIQKLLNGASGVVDAEGRDIFAGEFSRLRASGEDAGAVYRDVLARVFHTSVGGGLRLCDLRGRPGEIGLRASAPGAGFFGLIYIGDTASFKKIVEADASGIVLEEDAVSDSLFEGINTPDSEIEILIGAKKFMEGWNSWRVSSMGLLNIGRKEGSEIIQLFGRGVRLRGKDFLLKRSAALEGDHPECLPLLETLNIFAIRANYMAQFRTYLEKEGVDTGGDVMLSLPIVVDDAFLEKGLLVPRVPDGRVFSEECDFLLEADPDVRVHVDLSLKVQTLESGADGVEAGELGEGREVSLVAESLDLVNWEKLYLDLLEYKERKGMRNLAVLAAAPRAILSASNLYTLVAEPSLTAPDRFADVGLLNAAAAAILRTYTDAFYQYRRERWEAEHMEYRTLGRRDPNFRDYVLKVPRGESKLIASLRKAPSDGTVYRSEPDVPPALHFDRHLYQPLLVEKDERIRSDPPGLTPSERRFVEDLREYCASEKDGAPADAEVFLLRNLSRGKGVGFFNGRRFYPDFILWIRKADTQRIVFVEPHGMIHANAYQHDDKARLHEALPALAAAMGARCGVRGVVMDSYIVSATPFADLRKRYGDGGWDVDDFTRAHIVFPERTAGYDYIGIIVDGVSGHNRMALK